MSEIDRVAGLADKVKDLDRRIRVLESAPRVPTLSLSDGSGIQASSALGTITVVNSTTLGEPTSGSGGPEVDVKIGRTGRALVFISAQVDLTFSAGGDSSTYAYVGVQLSGANTVDPTTSDSGYVVQSRLLRSPNTTPTVGVNLPVSRALYLTGLTPGLTTMRLVYSQTGDTSAFMNTRTIAVVPL